MSDHDVKDYHFVEVPKDKLQNELEIPMLGLGTWKAEPGVVGKAVENALKLGYRHIDCAAMYENQDEIGRTLNKVFKQDGKINREDVWITSKLANRDHDPERVQEACRDTLRDLQIEQLDLYLMHWPVTSNTGPTLSPPIEVTWRAMEKLVDQGLTKCIGVSNFSVEKLKELRGYAHTQPVVQQIEGHPYFRNNYNIHFCKTNGMHVTGYSPLGTPDSASITHRDKEVPLLLKDPIVMAIAEKHNKQPAQVLLRWGIQRGTSVIPKATKVSHLKRNLEAANWELPPEDFKLLNFLGYQKRMVDGGAWFVGPHRPYKTLTDLWDYEEVTGWPPGVSTVGIEVK